MNNKLKIIAIAALFVIGTAVGIKVMSDSGKDEMIDLETGGTNVDVLLDEPGSNDDGDNGVSQLQQTDVEDSAASTAPSNATPESAAEISEKDSEKIMVHVCGEVISPGVYELEGESRVYEAIEMAGGFTDEASEDYLNLSSFISDGQKIYVPSVDEISELDVNINMTNETIAGSASNTGSASGNIESSDANGRININTATKEELMTLSGVGEAKAEAIISYRETNGPFKESSDIMNITGIKEGLYNKIKDYIYV